MIARRHVFHVAGYDAYDLEAQHRRFRRELAKFATTWKVFASASGMTQEGGVASWRATTRGPNWAVETTFEPFDWHDVVCADLAKPALPRLAAGAAAFADFVASGTLRRYFTANFRYALFFLVPFLDVVLFALVGTLAGSALSGALSLAGVMGAVVATAVALALFSLLLRWPGRSWRVMQGFADWAFARDYMYGRRHDVESRLDRFAERLVDVVHAGQVDEIVIVGHSLGATFVVDLVTRALARDPELTHRGPALTVLTIGATIPKLALHPAGERLRQCAERVSREPRLFWVEYQSRDDAISFYKFHPVGLCVLGSASDARQPLVRRVQFHEMLTAQDFRRLRLSFMRLHYQFVMANAKRATYDYFMIACGPLSLPEIARASNGPLDLLAADGSVVAAAPAAAGA
jgi:pimeloyl-ACP methyl ester carboxylesterase